jgi:hypothetical protein
MGVEKELVYQYLERVYALDFIENNVKTVIEDVTEQFVFGDSIEYA